MIYSQNRFNFFSFSFINFHFKIYFDFLISIIPTEVFNFIGLEKNVYNSFINWNSENALVGNITPSYFGQLILENRLLGIFFFPLNFLLVVVTHIYIINKYIKNNFNHILYLTFISLLLSSILNSTRMLNFIYFAPFWFILPLLFLYKKMNYKLPEKSTINFKNKFTNLIWYFVNTLIFPLTLRSNSLRRILLRSFGAKISKNSRISRLCKIEYPNNLTMGENSSIGNYCYILGLDKIEIGSNVCISDNVAILAGGHKLFK